jgi:hypothetical protein
MMRGWLIILLAVLSACLMGSAALATTPLKTRYVVLVISDGVRWQEVFTGAEKNLLTTDQGGNWASQDYLAKTYWRETPEERRKTVFPFIWSTIAEHGQILGNQTKNSIVKVTNPFAFSYPGYNEIITGIADPKIDSNEFGPNPNRNVFEWLNGQPELHGKVAVFGTWKTFEDIFNQERSKLAKMQVGWDTPYPGAAPHSRQALMNELYATTTKFDDEDVFDAYLQIPLMDYLQTTAPRLLFVGYGETDNWAHTGRYDLVLESAKGFDHFTEQLWNRYQSNPETRGKTTFILTTDHGRGSGPEEWKEHGTEEKGSENIWIAAIGPDTPPLGERHDTDPATQSQIAATIATLLGHDYRAVAPTAGAPLAEFLPSP